MTDSGGLPPGTALGELPPYLVSYSAAKAGSKDEEYEELMGSLEEPPSAWDIVKRMVSSMRRVDIVGTYCEIQRSSRRNEE